MRLWLGFGIALIGLGLAWLAGRLPGSSRPRRDTVAVLALTGVVGLFFWPVLIAGYAFPKGGGDLWGQLYPVWAFVAGQVRQGVFPLWDPLLMAGDPVFSEAQYGLLNPLAWPLFLVSPPPPDVVLGRVIVGMLLAGVGMYLFLARSPGLRLHVAAALVGAAAYMLGDPFIVHLGHPQFNEAMAWLPWSLLGVDWAVTVADRRRAAMGGIPLALMVLAGHAQASLYGLIAVGLYALWRWLAPGPAYAAHSFWDRLVRLLAIGFVGFALAAPALLPALERLPWTSRALVPEELRQGYEFSPRLLADILAPRIHGRGVDEWWPAIDRVENAYVGAVTLFLAVLGLVLQARRAGFWVGLGGLALLFSLGRQGPLYPVVADWPLFDATWKTARAISLTALALAVLGALGTQSLLDRQRWSVARGWMLALLVGAAVFGLGAPRLLDGVPNGEPYRRALANLRLVAVLALALAGLSFGWWRRRLGWAPPGVILLLVAELVALGATAEAAPFTPLAGPDHAQALEFLRSDAGWFRVDVQTEAGQLWAPAILQVQEFETLQGSGNPLSLWPFEQFYWTLPSRTAPGYRVLGAKYVIVPKGDPPGGEGIWPVFVEDPVIDVHLNTLALPRVRLVYRTEPVKDYEEAWRRVQAADYRPEEVAVVENGPSLDERGTGRIEVVRYSPNEVILTVHTEVPAFLVLSDVHYPGWVADLDGKRVPLYRADVVFRGVAVPAGSHQVRMRFRPRSLALGLGLGAIGLAAIVLPRRWKRKGRRAVMDVEVAS